MLKQLLNNSSKRSNSIKGAFKRFTTSLQFSTQYSPILNNEQQTNSKVLSLEEVKSVDLIEISCVVQEKLRKRIGKKWRVLPLDVENDNNEIDHLLTLYADNFNDYFKYCEESNLEKKYHLYHLFVDDEDMGPFNDLNLKRLIELAKPSNFGRGDKDVFDENVRKAKEIIASRISIRSENYRRLMDSKLGDVKLKEHTHYELHKLCIYEEGGFFSKHVDTVHDEKHYGSAVVCLPTQHEGGELIIRFDSKEKVIDFSKKSSEGKLQAVSFYTDCEHEVKPVTKGTRVVLHYDLLEWCSDNFYDYIIDSTEIGVTGLSEYSRLSANTAVIDQLVEQFNNFDNLVRELVGYPDLKYPLTPAIFLFHRYTFKGFDESKLKGIDRHLFDSLSQHFKLSLCPVVVDYCDYEEGPLTVTANIFDHDLVVGYKKDHPLLEKDITIIFNPYVERSKKIIHRQAFIERTGNERQPFELSYLSVILVLEKKDQ